MISSAYQNYPLSQGHVGLPHPCVLRQLRLQRRRGGHPGHAHGRLPGRSGLPNGKSLDIQVSDYLRRLSQLNKTMWTCRYLQFDVVSYHDRGAALNFISPRRGKKLMINNDPLDRENDPLFSMSVCATLKKRHIIKFKSMLKNRYIKNALDFQQSFTFAATDSQLHFFQCVFHMIWFRLRTQRAVGQSELIGTSTRWQTLSGNTELVIDYNVRILIVGETVWVFRLSGWRTSWSYSWSKKYVGNVLNVF